MIIGPANESLIISYSLGSLSYFDRRLLYFDALFHLENHILNVSMTGVYDSRQFRLASEEKNGVFSMCSCNSDRID